jgi:hypothetical protein
MRGHVVDDTTNDPVGTAGPARITHGGRTMTADPSTGAFVFPDLPRESKVGVDQKSPSPAPTSAREPRPSV